MRSPSTKPERLNLSPVAEHEGFLLAAPARWELTATQLFAVSTSPVTCGALLPEPIRATRLSDGQVRERLTHNLYVILGGALQRRCMVFVINNNRRCIA